MRLEEMLQSVKEKDILITIGGYNVDQLMDYVLEADKSEAFTLSIYVDKNNRSIFVNEDVREELERDAFTLSKTIAKTLFYYSDAIINIGVSRMKSSTDTVVTVSVYNGYTGSFSNLCYTFDQMETTSKNIFDLAEYIAIEIEHALNRVNDKKKLLTLNRKED